MCVCAYCVCVCVCVFCVRMSDCLRSVNACAFLYVSYASIGKSPRSSLYGLLFIYLHAINFIHTLCMTKYVTESTTLHVYCIA